ncbi:nuclear transport factor 2 family protein [Streptomyces sp. NPDC058457]|uniref:nuclear transport factor 2 family protein n=1 Tax=Streptomyces sp. NPDC058457 TaxID=3346507 RepID=UPI0036576D93
MFEPANDRQRHMVEVWERHGYAEFALHDPDAAIATMCDDPYIYCAPLGQLLNGRDEVYKFYSQWFLPNVPADVEQEPTTRVMDDNHIWDEFIFRFTHDREMPWKIPGVPPTGKPVEVVMNVVVGFEGDLIKYEHLMWDHASVLTQIGLLDAPAAGIGVKAPTLLRGLHT